jgi:hypothetical protein
MGLAALFALAIPSGAALAHVTRTDVLARLRATGTLRLDAQFIGVRFSRSRVVSLRYRVRGCYGVREAEWTLRPFRGVSCDAEDSQARPQSAHEVARA